ncbi:MAG TPA: polyprenol phosphomannose-dependent alpha 1,6 mannosyltransferase MptB [Actinoplanes sp.]|nr:polyprenol phosphomannose-dependent alpha 1,6 mannosyltransferase MptB [Actinoplanes sp.]
MIGRGVLGYLAVLAGGLVISVVPESAWAASLPPVSALRADLVGRMLGLTVVVAGLGLAAAAWLRLVQYAAAEDGHGAGERLGLVRRATAAWSIPLLVAPPLFSRDGWSYAAQGEMTRLGLNPYVWTPSVLDGPIVEAVDPRWMDTPTPYGPLPLLWGAFAAQLTDDPWLLVIAHRVLALVGVALLLWAVPRLAGWAGRDRAAATAIAVPSPLVLGHGVAGVHNDLLMVGLVAAALVVATERRGWVAGAVLAGLAAAVKLPGGLAGIGVALLTLGVNVPVGQRIRRLVQVAAVATSVLWLVGVLGGVGSGWVHALGVPGEVRTPLSAVTQLGWLTGVLLTPAGASVEESVAVARLLGQVAAVAVLGRLALRTATGVPATAVRCVALGLLVVVVLGPVVHHWYLLWCVPLLAACHLGRRASAALLGAGALPGLVGPLDSSLAGAGTLITLGVSLTVAVGLWLARLHHREGRPRRRAGVVETRPSESVRA